MRKGLIGREQKMVYAVMIQHNDSDTSCMRALVPAERTLASKAEHTLQCPNVPQCIHGMHVLNILVYISFGCSEFSCCNAVL